MTELENQRVQQMDRRNFDESSEHDKLVLMMAQHFKQLGYSDIKADIPGWTRPDNIYWTNKPDQKYIPDLTCRNLNGILIILEAETGSTLNDDHTKAQFEIFRAHATNSKGRFEVVVPLTCAAGSCRSLIAEQAKIWDVKIDEIWTPSK